jgi:hypothetical protein
MLFRSLVVAILALAGAASVPRDLDVALNQLEAAVHATREVASAEVDKKWEGFCWGPSFSQVWCTFGVSGATSQTLPVLDSRFATGIAHHLLACSVDSSRVRTALCSPVQRRQDGGQGGGAHVVCDQGTTTCSTACGVEARRSVALLRSLDKLAAHSRQV